MEASSNLSSDSTTCTATMETCYGGADLISELPDSLLHLILSFLDMKLVIQTSILAKRWRYLWTTLPHLKFSEEVYCNSIESLGKIPSFEAFMDFVGRVLLLHNGSDVRSFNLSYKDYYLLPMMIRLTDSWYKDFGGEQFTINYRSFELPQCLFTFKSLTTLDLDMGKKDKPTLELPHSVDLPSLKSLYLRTLCLVGGERLGKFISSFPVLEALFIINCLLKEPNNFTISALQLKQLVLHAFDLIDSRPEHCGITLSTPNLKLFYCTKGMHDYHFDDISSLDCAYVDLLTHMYMRKSNALLLPSEKLEAQNVMKCLRGLCNVIVLQLSDLFLEIVMKALTGLPSMITPFRNLRLLKITVYHSPCSIRTITIFLENCPEVEILILIMDKELEICKCCFDETKFYLGEEDECYSEAEVSPQCMLYHLKFVEILNVRGNVYELNLLKFLLENAMVLEKMTVTTSKELPPRDERRLEFKEKLVAFPRASSKAEVSFI